jgi:hypothetical protein
MTTGSRIYNYPSRCRVEEARSELSRLAMKLVDGSFGNPFHMPAFARGTRPQYSR